MRDTIVDFITFLRGGENGRHKSGSLVPDVRTKRSASLISVSDTGFECGTLVSLSR